jgi:hypothetical protein
VTRDQVDDGLHAKSLADRQPLREPRFALMSRNVQA